MSIMRITIEVNSPLMSGESHTAYDKRNQDLVDTFEDKLADSLKKHANEELTKFTHNSLYKAEISHWIM